MKGFDRMSYDIIEDIARLNEERRVYNADIDDKIRSLKKDLEQSTNDILSCIVGKYFKHKTVGGKFIKVLSTPQQEYTMMETFYNPSQVPVILIQSGSETITGKFTIRKTTMYSEAYKLGIKDFYKQWVEISKDEFYGALEDIIERIK